MVTSGNAGDGDDLAGARDVGVHAIERLGDVELRHPCRRDPAVRAAPSHLLTPLQCAVLHAANGEAPHVRRSIEVGHKRLQRVPLLEGRRRDRLEQDLEERQQVGGKVAGRPPGAARSGVAVHDRELDLRLVRIEVEEQLVDLVHHFVGARVGPVDLVHDEHDGKEGLERLAQDEARLGQRPFARVDEQQDTVDHAQCALDLTPEVGVAGRVDDVDLGARRTGRRCSWRGW